MGSQNTLNGGIELLQNDDFLKHLSFKFMVSSILGMFVLYAGAVINTMIVSMYLGEVGLAAISLVSPVYLVYYTAGAMGIGGSVVALRYIGKSDYLSYRQAFTCATELMVLACVVMTVLAYVFFEPLTRILSGGSESAALVADYLRMYIPGGAGTLMVYIPIYFLKTDGKPKASSMLYFLSSILNVLLCWLLIGPVCNMGIGGAGLATSISMSVTAVVGFFVLLRGNRELRLEKGSFTRRNICQILITGSPNGLVNLLESARIFLINILLLRVGTDMLLSSFTVVRNTMDLLTSIILGTSAALLPLVGIFHGERDHINIHRVMKLARRVGLAIIVPLILLVSLFPNAVSAIFGIANPQVLAENRLALPLSCIGLGFGYINTLYVGYLATVEREWIANLITALRLFVYLALFSTILSGPFGSVGIWVSFTLTEAATMLTYFVIRRYLRWRNRSLDIYLLDTKEEIAADITFSVRNNIEDIVVASDRITAFCTENEIAINRSNKVGLAVEEILSVLIVHCLNPAKEQYVDIRVRKLNDEVMIRFRYTGKIFDPVRYYELHKADEEMMSELLGLKLIINASSLIEFRQTFGSNNLMIIF
ncbi:MAG: MATE family efflux transporter [Hydrogenoanaerobacterium sp.]